MEVTQLLILLYLNLILTVMYALCASKVRGRLCDYVAIVWGLFCLLMYAPKRI